MERYLRGKRKLSRVVALVMAFALVISNLYMSDRTHKAQAATPADFANAAAFNYVPKLTYNNVTNKASVNKYTDQYGYSDAKIRYLVDQNETATFSESWSSVNVGSEIDLSGSAIEAGSDGTYYFHAVYYLASGSDTYVSEVKTSEPCIKATKTVTLKGARIESGSYNETVNLEVASDAQYINGKPNKYIIDLTDRLNGAKIIIFILT